MISALLQGQQQEAEGGDHGQLTQQAMPLPQNLITGIEAHADLQQRQGQQEQKGAGDQGVDEAPPLGACCA